METRLIECKLIDVPKADGTRTFSKEFAVTLSDSLKVDGQLHPAVVRPNLEAPGRFIMVTGKHRLYALKNVLKEQFILCTIAEDMDEAEAKVVADVENLFRNPLNKAQHAAALKRWHAHWLAKTPALPPKGARAVGAGNQTDQTAAGAVTSEAEFDEKVAAVTGQSASTVRRSKAVANAFTADQLEVFVQMDVNQTDMMTIARIKDVGRRGEVVSLVASGMVVADAIKEVMKDAAPSRYNNGGAAADAAKAAAKTERAPEMSDDEWFNTYCGVTAALLGDPARFKGDAILFRTHSELRHAYRSKGKKSLAETKKAGAYGAFWSLVNRLLSISHPKDWLLCPACKGKGVLAGPSLDVTGAARCQKCYGGGYLLRTEEYL